MNLYYCGGNVNTRSQITPDVFKFLKEIDGRIIFAAERECSFRKAIMVFKGTGEDACMVSLKGYVVHPYYHNPDNIISNVIDISNIKYKQFIHDILYNWYNFCRVPNELYVDSTYYDFTTVDVRRPDEYLR